MVTMKCSCDAKLATGLSNISIIVCYVLLECHMGGV